MLVISKPDVMALYLPPPPPGVQDMKVGAGWL